MIWQLVYLIRLHSETTTRIGFDNVKSDCAPSQRFGTHTEARINTQMPRAIARVCQSMALEMHSRTLHCVTSDSWQVITTEHKSRYMHTHLQATPTIMAKVSATPTVQLMHIFDGCVLIYWTFPVIQIMCMAGKAGHG